MQTLNDALDLAILTPDSKKRNERERIRAAAKLKRGQAKKQKEIEEAGRKRSHQNKLVLQQKRISDRHDQRRVEREDVLAFVSLAPERQGEKRSKHLEALKEKYAEMIKTFRIKNKIPKDWTVTYKPKDKQFEVKKPEGKENDNK